MEEYEYQEAFQLLGKLMLKFEEKDSERAQPYLAALNKLYFYTNELRLKDIENTMLIDKYREK